MIEEGMKLLRGLAAEILETDDLRGVPQFGGGGETIGDEPMDPGPVAGPALHLGAAFPAVDDRRRRLLVAGVRRPAVQPELEMADALHVAKRLRMAPHAGAEERMLQIGRAHV